LVGNDAADDDDADNVSNFHSFFALIITCLGNWGTL
jgi:hypothetical protein